MVDNLCILFSTGLCIYIIVRAAMIACGKLRPSDQAALSAAAGATEHPSVVPAAAAGRWRNRVQQGRDGDTHAARQGSQGNGRRRQRA